MEKPRVPCAWEDSCRYSQDGSDAQPNTSPRTPRARQKSSSNLRAEVRERYIYGMLPIGKAGLRILRSFLGALLILAGCGKEKEAQAPASPVAKPQHAAVTAPKARFHSKAPGYTNWWLEWSRDTYGGSYQRAGKKDPKWDEPAAKALEAYAYFRVFGHGPPGSAPDVMPVQLKLAMDAGCTDPYIHYLYLKTAGKPPESADAETAAEYSKLADEMQTNGYPVLCKGFVSLRASQAWLAAFKKQAPEVNRYRRQAMGQFEEMLERDEIPAGAAYDAYREMYWAIARNDKQRQDFYKHTEPALLARWPDEGFPYLIKGKFYVDYAWDARGNGYADTVTEEGGSCLSSVLARRRKR